MHRKPAQTWFLAFFGPESSAFSALERNRHKGCIYSRPCNSRHWRGIRLGQYRALAIKIKRAFETPPCRAKFVQLKFEAKAHTRGGVPAKICIPARENLSRSSRNALHPMPPPRVSFFALIRILRRPPSDC